MTEQMDNRINSQACAWIAKLHGGKPTAQEKQQLSDWMAKSPAHRAEIRKVAKLWGELNVLTELAVAIPPAAQPSRFSLWLSSINSLLDWRLASGGAVAATLLMAVMIMPGIFNGSDLLVHDTAVGEQRRVTLDDGSTVLLNTNSQVRVDYQPDARNIYLQRGQAHFEVATNIDRPFRVYAGEEMVRAVGTAFSVYISHQALEVTVTEGVVELNARQALNIPQPVDTNQEKPSADVMGAATRSAAATNAPAINTSATYKPISLVRAGQNIRLSETTTAPEVQTIPTQELSRKLSWHHGMLRFSGDALEDVVAEISRYTDLQIKILDPSISQLRIGGFFKVGETDKMFEALERSFGVQVLRVGDSQVQLVAAKTQ